MKNVDRLIFITLLYLTACQGGVTEQPSAPGGGVPTWLHGLNQSILLLDNLRALATAF